MTVAEDQILDLVDLTTSSLILMFISMNFLGEVVLSKGRDWARRVRAPTGNINRKNRKRKGRRG